MSSRLAQPNSDACKYATVAQAVTKRAIKGKNALPTTGIPYVIVNGTIVVKDSKVQKGVCAGKPVRLPVQN